MGALLAITGQADIDLANVDALLSDMLDGEDDVFLFVPATNETYSAGLETVIEWANEASIPYGVIFDPEEKPNRKVKALIDGAEERIDIVDDFVAEFLDIVSNADEETKHVLFLVGDALDDWSYGVLEEAKEAGLSTLDLTGGLDDIVLEEAAGDPEPEPEPEPEPAKPARRGRAKKEEDAPEDLPHDKQTPAEESGEVDPIVYLRDQAQRLKNQAQNLLDLADVFEQRLAAGADKPRGVPRGEETEATAPYLLLEDGTHVKRGRGRPPKGSTVVHLTPSEAAEFGIEE